MMFEMDIHRELAKKMGYSEAFVDACIKEFGAYYSELFDKFYEAFFADGRAKKYQPHARELVATLYAHDDAWHYIAHLATEDFCTIKTLYEQGVPFRQIRKRFSKRSEDYIRVILNTSKPCCWSEFDIIEQGLKEAIAYENGELEASTRVITNDNAATTHVCRFFKRPLTLRRSRWINRRQHK